MTVDSFLNGDFMDESDEGEEDAGEVSVWTAEEIEIWK